jgi:hypothetical protein
VSFSGALLFETSGCEAEVVAVDAREIEGFGWREAEAERFVLGIGEEALAGARVGVEEREERRRLAG